MGETAVVGNGAGTQDQSAWGTDVLGAPFVARTIEVTEGEERLTATLVRRGEPQHARAVLYVHGFSDYFYQADHARVLSEGGGLDFYALDLRRYGRSLAAEQQAGYVQNLHAYFEEIGAALQVLREEGHTELVLLGHSTGGLVTTLYAHHHPGEIDALVLNSPWYDINDSALRRITSTPLARAVAWRDPSTVISRLDRKYTSSIHASTGGAWDFDLAWKPLEGFPVRAGWISAIRRGQREVADGVHLRLPVLMCTSTRSGGANGRPVTPAQIRSSDTVLNVAHMWREAGRLGPDVTLRTVPGGLHDLSLSAPPARADYEHAVLDWLQERLGASAHTSTSASPTPEPGTTPSGSAG